MLVFYDLARINLWHGKLLPARGEKSVRLSSVRGAGRDDFFA